VLHEKFDGVDRDKRSFTAKHFVHDEPQRIQIAASIDGIHSFGRFWSKIRKRSEDCPGHRQRGRVIFVGHGIFGLFFGKIAHLELGQTEVDDLEGLWSPFGDHDVSRFDVAVKNAFRVDGMQRRRDLRSEMGRAPRRERALFEHFVQRHSPDVLEDEEVTAVWKFSEVSCCCNVRMLNVRAGDCFTLETFDQLRKVFRFRVE
jgi:hypothetical protein